MSHRLDRLELVIQTADEALARPLLDRLSRLHHQTLQGVLERVLDQLSPAGPVHRLERLELDLGEIPADRLERELPLRLERALRQALPARLPEALLRDEAPGRERSRPAAPAETAWEPPLAAAEPAQRQALVAAPSPEGPAAVRPEPRAVEEPAERLDGTEVADARRPEGLEGPEGADAIPQGQAAGLVSGREAPPSSEPASAAPGIALPRELELLASYASGGQLPWWAPRDEPRRIPAALEVALALARELPEAERGGWWRRLAPNRPAWERLLAAAEPAQRPGLRRAWFAALPPDGQTAKSVSGREAPPPSAAPGAPLPRRREQAAGDRLEIRGLPIAPARHLRPPLDEALTVDGAGLVLLWPFLETLLSRLAWLTPERRFLGTVEQQRAVALLGCLVDGDPRPPEWRLTLAKLLCGLPLEEVCALEEPLDEAEVAAAEALLRAVLAHGEGLLGEAIEELRLGWLRRPGLLSWRPGAWLLVVERREGDEALERLPWRWEWIRLPWMGELLQVVW